MSDRQHSMTQAPRVSLGLPVYNGGAFLRPALESIVQQSFSDFELIISDNCSTDDTAEVCAEYAARDNRIRYVRQPRNMGVSWNWRYVLQQADGALFAWVAADDLRHREFLARIVDFLDRNPDVMACGCDVEWMDERAATRPVKSLHRIRPSVPWEDARVAFFEQPVTEAFLVIYGLFRTEFVRSVPLPRLVTRHRLASGADWLFMADAATRGRIAAIPEVLVQYRVHADSMHQQEVHGISQLRVAEIEAALTLRLLEIAMKADLPVSTRIQLCKAALSDIRPLKHPTQFAHRTMGFLRRKVAAFVGVSQ